MGTYQEMDAFRSYSKNRWSGHLPGKRSYVVGCGIFSSLVTTTWACSGSATAGQYGHIWSWVTYLSLGTGSNTSQHSIRVGTYMYMKGQYNDSIHELPSWLNAIYLTIVVCIHVHIFYHTNCLHTYIYIGRKIRHGYVTSVKLGNRELNLVAG